MKKNPKRTTSVDRKLGVLIRTRRKQLGLSQTALGTEVGLTFQQVQKYERGVNRISVGRFIDITEALDLKPAQVLRKIAA